MPKSDVDLSVILVSYNTANLLATCLDRLLLAARGLVIQVLVVDNASRDHSVSVLHRRGAEIELVENAENVGFGRANDQVLARVKGRHVLLLNTDALVPENALGVSVSYMDSNVECGVLGVRLVDGSGRLQPSCRYFPTPLNSLLVHFGKTRFMGDIRAVDDMTWDHASVRACDWVPGCYYMVRKQVIDAVGLFDPRYFLYFEEVDHCRLVKQAGWQVIYLPSPTVVHLGGESAKAETPELSRAKQISVLEVESGFLYFRKHHGAVGAWSSLIVGWLSETVIALRRSRGPGRVSDHWRNAWRSSRSSLAVFVATLGGRRATR